MISVHHATLFQIEFLPHQNANLNLVILIMVQRLQYYAVYILLIVINVSIASLA